MWGTSPWVALYICTYRLPSHCDYGPVCMRCSAQRAACDSNSLWGWLDQSHVGATPSKCWLLWHRHPWWTKKSCLLVFDTVGIAGSLTPSELQGPHTVSQNHRGPSAWDQHHGDCRGPPGL